jgi:Spy/CpxP family protein refolding chaperone
MLLIKLPLLLSTALFTLAASDADAAAAPAAKVEGRPAAEPGARGDHGHARRDLCTQLGCSAAQRTTITKALTDMRTKMKALGGHGDRNASLAKAMADGKLDRAEVLAALHGGDAERAKRDAIMADTIVAIHGALDVSQRAALVKLVSEHGSRAMFGGGHGKHGGGKPGAKGKPERKAQRGGGEHRHA